MTEKSWLPVTGFGAHIKSTRTQLIVQKKKTSEFYPLESFNHLLIAGGHTISTATISQLVNRGIYISFFNADGTSTGTLRPFPDRAPAELQIMQQNIPRHRYAIAIAAGAVRARLMAITRMQEENNTNLFYEGELEFLRESEKELAYLIKMDEIRRLHRLTSDMYYEIMARTIPPDRKFKRRTERPHSDPVNAMLSFGYSILYGIGSVSVIGAFLDPDIGVLQEGKGSLVQDLIEPLKAEMVDRFVFQIAKDALRSGDYESSGDRCILSDELMKKLIDLFYMSIDRNKINAQITDFCESMKTNGEFRVPY